MEIKIVATDMDGTLLDPRGQLDLPRLEKILDKLDHRGVRFFIATGNEVHRMRFKHKLGMMPWLIKLWATLKVENVRISLS